MRSVLQHNRPRGSLELMMTPMIDVVFLLLVFFLWTASFQIAEQVLPSRLIESAGSAEQVQRDPEIADFDRVIVRLLWEGDGPVWLVNDRPRGSLAEVREMLTELARLKPDAPVILDPDGNTPLGYVIDLYDASRLAGFEEIQFAASEKMKS